mgnify:CR=1 FL=1
MGVCQARHSSSSHGRMSAAPLEVLVPLQSSLDSQPPPPEPAVVQPVPPPRNDDAQRGRRWFRRSAA